MSGDFSKSAQASYLSQVGIDDLAEPTPVDLPNIPYLPPVRGKVTQPKQPKPPGFACRRWVFAASSRLSSPHRCDDVSRCRLARESQGQARSISFKRRKHC